MRRFFLRTLAVLALIAVIAFASRETWLRWLGEALVRSDGLTNAQAVICLAGDPTGSRIVQSAELVRQGRAPVVLVSGPAEVYGLNEADIAINFAQRKGYPRESFRAVYHSANSTREEAVVFRETMRKAEIRTALLVTSNYHSRRAGRIFRSIIPEVEFHVVAAQGTDFAPDSWWKTRPPRKILFLEWTKVVAEFFGI